MSLKKQITSFTNNSYLVDKQVLVRCGSITVDFAEEKDWSGFTLISEKPLVGGC